MQRPRIARLASNRRQGKWAGAGKAGWMQLTNWRRSTYSARISGRVRVRPEANDQSPRRCVGVERFGLDYDVLLDEPYMPIHEYACSKCGQEFDMLVGTDIAT
jgi:hypothetical protein